MLSDEARDKFLDGLPDQATVKDVALMSLVLASVYDLEVDQFKAVILSLAAAIESDDYAKMKADKRARERMN
jgi:hypothetical protein